MMDWDRLYRIADLNCGDLLKATLMNYAEPELKISRTAIMAIRQNKKRAA